MSAAGTEHPKDAVGVLVASDDAAFRRLCAVGLGQAGFAVKTATVDAGRIRRLLQAGDTRVVVLDAGKAREQLQAAIASAEQAIGVVPVNDEGSLGITRWGPLAALVAEVQVVAEEAAAKKRVPHLRIVS